MTERRAPRPCGKPYDEIRITTEPYFRIGSVGQSEWRTSKTVKLVNKGKVLDMALDPDTKWLVVQLVERLLMSQRERVEDERLITQTDQCDQEGCEARSTVTYKMKARYDGGSEPINIYKYDSRPLIRKFCDAHKKRGDGYYEDSDDNYELLTEPV